ncbi:MAG: glycosyltransferase family 2 protein [Chloroflexi bacterium]|nr:glycosyltransferase family 2 protein [Chloroflexota bacterium]
MTTLSAVVLARNEERHLPDCLASLAWADEMLVVDSFSTDRTPEITRAAGARLEERAFVNYAAMRDTALGLATGDWVLFVDADERVPGDLRDEVRATINAAPDTQAGYWIPRKNYIFGAWIRHTGWYPDRQLRLMRRAGARYDPARTVHELVVLDGDVGELTRHLTHINYETIGEFIRKQRYYAQFDAHKLWQQGVRPQPRKFVTQPLREFYRRFVQLSGWRDGWRGWLLCGLMAWYQFEIYRLMRRQGAGDPGAGAP